MGRCFIFSILVIISLFHLQPAFCYQASGFKSITKIVTKFPQRNLLSQRRNEKSRLANVKDDDTDHNKQHNVESLPKRIVLAEWEQCTNSDLFELRKYLWLIGDAWGNNAVGSGISVEKSLSGLTYRFFHNPHSPMSVECSLFRSDSNNNILSLIANNVHTNQINDKSSGFSLATLNVLKPIQSQLHELSFRDKILHQHDIADPVSVNSQENSIFDAKDIPESLGAQMTSSHSSRMKTGSSTQTQFANSAEHRRQKAIEELNNIVQNSIHNNGFLNAMQESLSISSSSILTVQSNQKDIRAKFGSAANYLFDSNSTSSVDSEISMQNNANELSRLENLLQRPLERKDNVLNPLRPVDMSPPQISQDSPTNNESAFAYYPMQNQTLECDRNRLLLLVNELSRAPVDLTDMVLDAYRDLMLSDNMVYLLKEQNEKCRDLETRKIYSKIATKTSQMVSQLSLLAKSEETRHLRTLHKICQIASQYQHDEDIFVREMNQIRPYFDTNFLSFIKFSLELEERKCKHAGIPMSDWYNVLSIVYKGVFADFERRFDRVLDPILLVLRFSEASLRSEIFERFVNITNTLDLPSMKQIALNLVSAMRDKIALDPSCIADSDVVLERLDSLEKDVAIHLSDVYIRKRIAQLKQDALSQGQILVEEHLNPDWAEYFGSTVV